MTEVVLYTRAGCHLCEEAEAVVLHVARHAGATVRLVDIDDDPVLVDRYTVRVPVVAVDGVEVAEFVVDEAALRTALAPAAEGRRPPR